MGLEAYDTFRIGTVALIILIGVILDQIYQRHSHKWTNEPPLLPYRIPIIGHALTFQSEGVKLFKRANDHFPDYKPYSLLLFGKRVYVFSHPKDVSIVFRKSKALPFLPLIKSLSGLAWNISSDGMRRLSEVDETGDSIFGSAHEFYRDALKPGPQLDKLTLKFLRYLQKMLDEYEAEQTSGDISLARWSRTMIGSASTNAMIGPSLLLENPDLLDSVWLVDRGFFLYVNRIPRIFARKYFRARDNVLSAFERYFADEKNKEESTPMIWDRGIQLREKGMTTKDIAAYSYSAYALLPSLVTNAVPTAARILRHIFTRKHFLTRVRAEIAPAFADGNSVTTLEQVNHLVTSCPLLRAFFNETLRLHSSAGTNRRVVEDTSVSGYILKTGNNIICPPYAQHHAPEYFGQHLDKFDPERFTEPALEKGTPADPKMVRAFGGGVSLCPGRFFAASEVLSYVACVVWRYDIEFKQGLVSIVPRNPDM